MYVIDYYSSFFFLGFRFHSFFFSFFSTRKLYTKGGGEEGGPKLVFVGWIWKIRQKVFYLRRPSL